jgi:hypothetical protein
MDWEPDPRIRSKNLCLYEPEFMVDSGPAGSGIQSKIK